MITFKKLLEKLFKEAETAAVKAPAGKISNRAQDRADTALKKVTAKTAKIKLIEPTFKKTK